MKIHLAIVPLILLVELPAQAQVFLRPGSYLKSTYIQAVRKSKSPFASIGKGGVLEIVVSALGGKTVLSPVVNFHDSGTDYYLESNQRAVRVDNGNSKDTLDLAVKSPDSFSISTPGDFFGHFEFVGSTDEFLRSQTVAGVYLDQQGRKYIFGVDGAASFPDHQFTYQVGCDHFEARFDYLFGKEVDWAFKLSGDTLKLFKCNGDGPAGHDPKPFLTLKRVAK